MEPKLPTPNFGHERAPANYGNTVEYSPKFNPEEGVERPLERLEQQEASVESSMAHAVPVLPVLPQPQVSTAQATSLAAVSDDLPLVANDDDLIEKEWVDKAKKIIVETKDDPYKREQNISRLQADYLRKRYGRELGASS